MKWDVRTANPKNGRERVITVSAPNADAALAKVSGHGLLVQGDPVPRTDLPDDDGDAPEVIDYRSPNGDAATVLPPDEEYRDVVKWGRALGSASWAFAALAYLAFAGAILGFFAAVIALTSRPDAALLAFGIAVQLGFGGACLYAIGATLRWLDAVGLVIRDIAVNSRARR